MPKMLNYKRRLKAQERALLFLLESGPVETFDHAKIAVQRAITMLSVCGYAVKLDRGWTLTTLGNMACNHQRGLEVAKLSRRSATKTA